MQKRYPTFASTSSATRLQAAWRATMARRRDDGVPTADAVCPRRMQSAWPTTTVLRRDAPAVIFLDIDGVICTSSTGTALIRDVLLEQLKRIVHACNAKVVLSTDWRRIKRRKELAERKLADKGIECVGATPYAGQDANVRPKEIAAWLRDDGRNINITRWVAIDDRLLTDEDGGEFLIGRCVTTEFATGLTAERADEAIQLLQGQ